MTTQQVEIGQKTGKIKIVACQLQFVCSFSREILFAQPNNKQAIILFKKKNPGKNSGI
jgi:hypothetical protein